MDQIQGEINYGKAIPASLSEEGKRTVYFFRSFSGEPATACTGTLLRNNVVLTARHCMNKAGDSLYPLGRVGVLEDSYGGTSTPRKTADFLTLKAAKL